MSNTVEAGNSGEDKNNSNIALPEQELVESNNEQKSISRHASLAVGDSQIKSEDEKSGFVKQNAADELEQDIESSDENLPFSEIYKKKLFQELMNEAENRSKLLKTKLVSQLNEVFKMFDINRDGIIDESDLKFTFTSLGDLNVSDEKIKKMINESSKPIDFNAFVGLFESKEMEFDSETDLIKAFSKWDNKSNGFMYEESLKNDLQSWGDRFSEKEANYALEEAPIYEQDGKSSIDYVEFCANICGLQNISKSELFNEKYLNEKK